MTREQLNGSAFPVDSSDYLDIELPNDQMHEAVLLADALAYGADERAAGVIEGMTLAAQANCPGCAVSELCDAEIAKRQELDCRVFALERKVEAARGALTASQRFTGIEALKRGPLAMLAEAVKNHCEIALAQLIEDAPTGESGANDE